MNAILAAGAMIVFGFVEVTNPASTTWLDDYGTALQVARLTQRPLLVVLENPHEKDQRLGEVADDERLAGLLSKFELCRVDVTTDYGKQVAEAYGATTFPYTAITDRRCRSVVFRGAGKASPEIWLRTLSVYSNGDSEKLAATDNAAGENGKTYESPKLFSHPDLATALSASKDSGRPLLVFVTMPGCYHCVRMKSETYQDPSLQMQIAREFESVVVDQTDEPDWVHEKGVTLFPTTLVLDQNGEVTARLPGYVSAQELAIRLSSMSGRSISSL